MKKGTLYVDESTHKYFAMIPYMVIEMSELSHIAFRLYIYLKRVCGDEGRCWMTIETLAKKCSMRRASVIKARKELEKHKLIRMERRRKENGALEISSFVLDVWKTNKKIYDKQKEQKIKQKGGESVSATHPPKGIYARDTDPEYARDTLSRTLKKEEESKSHSCHLPVARASEVSQEFNGDNLGLDNKKPYKKNGDTISNEGERKKNRQATLPTSWDIRAAEELTKIVSKHIKVNKNAKPTDWAKQFRLMRTKDGVSKKEIRRALEWYSKHIGQEYIPECYAAKTFREKYTNGKILAAMQRTEGAGSKGISEEERYKIINRVRIWLQENTDWNMQTQAPSQKTVNRALTSLGYKEGDIKWSEI